MLENAEEPDSLRRSGGVFLFISSLVGLLMSRVDLREMVSGETSPVCDRLGEEQGLIDPSAAVLGTDRKDMVSGETSPICDRL